MFDILNIYNFKEKIITPGDALQRLDDIQCRPEIIEKITKGQKVEMKLTSEDKFLRLLDKKRNIVGNYYVLIINGRFMSIRKSVTLGQLILSRLNGL